MAAVLQHALVAAVIDGALDLSQNSSLYHSLRHVDPDAYNCVLEKSAMRCVGGQHSRPFGLHFTSFNSTVPFDDALTPWYATRSVCTRAQHVCLLI